MKERKHERSRGREKQNFEIWANWLKTDKERERDKERRGGGTYCEAEITCFLFFFLFWDSYGCSSLWYMGQAGGETLSERATTCEGDRDTILKALLCFSFLKTLSEPTNWFDCRVEMLAKCHLRWIKKKDRRRGGRRGGEAKEPELAPHTALSIYMI